MTPAPLALPTSAADWPAWFQERTQSELARASELVDGLRTAPPTQPVDVLRQWDRAAGHLGNAEIGRAHV